MLLNILFILALTFPVAVASTAFGIDNLQTTTSNMQLSKKLMFALILALGQGVMYSLGSLLGGAFMHTVARFSNWIVFVLCFYIAFRMLMETIKIKKGANLYFVETKKQLLLLSIALGVNSFIAGLIAEFLPLFQNLTPYIIMAAAFVWSIVTMLIPFSNMKLTFNSLLNLIFSAVVAVMGMLFMINNF